MRSMKAISGTEFEEYVWNDVWLQRFAPSQGWNTEFQKKGGMHFTPGYPISCGWLIRRPRTCCTISE